MKQNHTALILSGGGARAAYQVGVLSAIGKMMPKHSSIPFPILCGTSAGALNAAMLAANADNFTRAISKLAYLWRHLSPDQIYHVDSLSMMSSVSRILLSLFQHGSPKQQLSLLNNQPLRQLLQRFLDLDRINTCIHRKHLRALSITAMSYSSGKTTSFFQGSSNLENWENNRNLGLRSRLTYNHLLASSAIPTIFPAQKIGEHYFADGAMRQQSPISPALHLGAKKVMIIGVSGNRAPKHWNHEMARPHPPSIAQITGQLLNSAFIDNLEDDIQQLERINQLSMNQPQSSYEAIDTLIISPSVELDQLAAQHYSDLPRSLKYVMSSIGATPKAGGSSAASYLLFTKDYCRSLIELGQKDANWEKDKIMSFLNIPAHAKPVYE
ncbi:patatin-like phospholipase family protein [Marinomonas sp. PE14-40]|uniref:patatin-like phospholipase family protein n=1 Tax=Marinomonas sp. PE14-40 TaxID=3060621 RepID=UPI003F66DE62